MLDRRGYALVGPERVSGGQARIDGTQGGWVGGTCVKGTWAVGHGGSPNALEGPERWMSWDTLAVGHRSGWDFH